LNTLIYLASPYSSPTIAIQQQRYELICQIAGELILQGHVVFSPVVHGHGIAEHGNVATDWTTWGRLDLELLRRCDEVWVAMISGWDNSIGVEEEVIIAIDLGKPVGYLNPTSLKVNYPTSSEVG
jgi:hypothetical protein